MTQASSVSASEPPAIDWPRFRKVIAAHQRFLLTSHIRPDCDALGSELGLAGVLRALGKQAIIVNGQATPPNLAFIDPHRELKALDVDVKAENLADIEVLVVLDTSAWAQLGPMAAVVRATKARKIVLDHHVGEDDLGAELFKDTRAEATGRLVADAARELGVPLDLEIANALFVALATDTGWFRFGSTTPTTLRVAADLVQAGARPSALYNLLYEQDTLARLKLRGRILARAEAELDGRLIHTSVLREDFDATGALPSDTEDVINLTLGVAGTLVAVILVEQPGGGFKISFRSRIAKVDCNELAKQFSGGGHKAAAGAFLNEPFESARAKVLSAARTALQAALASPGG
jgi:phosphoesterase RecJ-like protein